MPNVIHAYYEIKRFPVAPVADIEEAARTCYKSEDLIKLGSGETLVRNLIEKGHWPMIEFAGDLWVKIYSNRGFTHEQVRHRLASYAQESTRYCNYGKEKFGRKITVCDPADVIAMKTQDPEKRARWRLKMLNAWAQSEENYLDLVDDGCPAELAREVLTIGTKAEINVKANCLEFRHIFKLRASKRAHPRMREVMVPLLAEAKKLVPVVFEDL